MRPKLPSSDAHVPPSSIFLLLSSPTWYHHLPSALGLFVASSSQTSSDLFLMHFESVAVCHLERVRGIRRLHSRAVEQEPHRVEGLALALAKGRHELLELGAALDLEEDLVVVVGDLDVEVLGVGGRVLAIAWGLVGIVFGHVFCVVFICARAYLFTDAVSRGW